LLQTLTASPPSPPALAAPLQSPVERSFAPWPALFSGRRCRLRVSFRHSPVPRNPRRYAIVESDLGDAGTKLLPCWERRL